MKFFNDKKVIFTLFSISLFNNVVADGYNNYMGHHEVVWSDPKPFVSNNAPQPQMFYSSSDPDIKSPPLEDLLNQDDAGKINPKQVGINQINGVAGFGEVNKSSPRGEVGTTAAVEPVFDLSITPTSRAIATSTTESSSTTPTTGTSATQADLTPASKPQNQFVAAIVTVIKSIFNILWSYKDAIWSFFNTNILTPTWNWIKQKWFS